MGNRFTSLVMNTVRVTQFEGTYLQPVIITSQVFNNPYHLTFTMRITKALANYRWAASNLIICPRN